VFAFLIFFLKNVHLLIGSKNGRKPVVGVAHHVSFTRPYGLFDVAAVTLANSLTLFTFIDSICDKLDFVGINYYGQVT
jgi:galactolipid galactosyltransferase